MKHNPPVVTLLLAGALMVLSALSDAAENCPPAVEQARKLLRQEEQLIPRPARPLAGVSATPDLVKVAQLVAAAEQACRSGDMDGANTKAKAALSELERR